MPAWARVDAFPEKPKSSPYGCVDQHGKSEEFETLKDLKDFLSAGKSKLGWIWVPEQERLIAPEEVPSFEKTLLMRRSVIASDDLDAAHRNLVLFGAILIWALYAASQNTGVFSSQSVGLTVILFLILGVKPWWESRQTLTNLGKTSISEEVPEARFELWLGMQKVWLTPLFVGLIIAVFLGQKMSPTALEDAGIQKALYRAGDWWRIYTGAFLHGGLLHMAMNVSALWYLGRRTEVLARWPHLAAVFFISIIGAGWATVSLMPNIPSVGISGAVSGLLGFLLVFETLHRPLVPRPVRTNLVGMLILMIVIGALGFRFIDNAAHAGGLLTGAAYAAIVFPKSSSPHRPEILTRDRVIGITTLSLALLSGLLALVIILVKK